MGKKTKNRKKIKNSIPTTFDLEEVLQARILKLEYQLHEIEVQKEAEIAAALETGRKEGYILGRQERLEAARQVVDITGTIRAPRDITALHSDSRNPWGGLSWRHRRSHPHKPSACIRHHPFYTTDNRKQVPLVPSSTEIVETVRHPYGIGSAKPAIRAPITNSFVASPIHHTPLVSESILQPLLHTTFFHYILFKFVPGMVSYTFSVFSVLFWRR